MADPASIAGTAVGALSLGIQVTHGLYQYYATYQAQSETVKQTSARLETLTASLKLLQDSIANRKPSVEEADILKAIDASLGCEESIDELREEYEKLQKHSAEGLKGSIIVAGRRLIYPLRDSTLRRLDENIQAIRDNVLFALEILQVRDYKQLSDDQLEIKRVIEAIQSVQISTEIRQWLDAPDATVNHNLNCAKRHPGTGSWLIRSSQYQSWSAQPGSVLWIVGFAGCGKSVLCSTVIQHAFRKRSPRVAITFFYFTFTEDAKQDSSAMLRSLLQQLSAQSPDGALEMSNLYKSYKPGKPPDTTLLAYLQRLVQRFEHVYVILDALDEAQRSTRYALLQTLVTMQNWTPSNLHLLVTSRDENYIRDALQKIPSTSIPMDNAGIDEDIRSFILGQLHTDDRLLRWKDHHEEIEKSLTQRAHGVFRWVECQLDSIKRCPRIYKRLQQCLATLPSNLDATYEQCLYNIDEQSIRDARQILLVLLHAFRVLTVPELADAIAVDLEPPPHFDNDLRCEDADTIREICPVLVQVYTPEVVKESSDKELTEEKLADEQHSPSSFVRIAHFSVQEYLRSPRIKTQNAHRFAIDDTQGQTEMAKICLIYLLRTDDESAGSTTVEKQYPLMRYAAKFWFYHYLESEKDDVILRGLVSQLIMDHDMLRRWYSWFDQTASGATVVNSSHGSLLSLHFASLFGIGFVVRQLLDAKVNVNGRFDMFSRTALGVASRQGHLEVVKMLLDEGADVDNHNDSCTALEEASARGHLKVVQLLLERGAKVNKTLGTTDITALLAALRHDHLDIVRMLLNHGAEVRISGLGAFRLDSIDEKEPSGAELSMIVKILYEQGSKAHIRDSQYDRILRRACEIGDVQIVRDMLDAGVKINGLHGSSGTALQAASFYGHAQIVQLLLDRGARPNIVNDRSFSALRLASEKGHTDIVKMLLEQGANVNGDSDVNETPSVSSDIARDYSDVSGGLMEENDIRAHPSVGMPADLNEHLETWGPRPVSSIMRVFEGFVQAMDVMNPINTKSPLLAAVMNNHVTVVRTLLDAGANANCMHGFGISALRVSQIEGHEEISKLLLEYGA